MRVAVLYFHSVAERGSDLNTHRNLLQDYDLALDNFLSWLANQESSADILLEEIKQNDPMRSSTWASRSKVCCLTNLSDITLGKCVCEHSGQSV